MMNRKTLTELTNLCLIYNTNNEILVEEKITKYGKKIVLPGGHVENNESLKDSIIREIYEETNLVITNPILCGIKDKCNADNSRFIVFLYKCNRFTGKIKSSNEGNVFWMKKEDFINIDTIWNMKEILKVIESNQSDELYLFDENFKIL